jgi:N-acetylglucosaminyldiphosphoundecaprenol N-acetyl-beta-D-mannosaminyltransferase
MDLFADALAQAAAGRRAVFFLGGDEATLAAIRSRLSRECTGVRAGFYAPPYRQRFSRDENPGMVRAVNEFRPDILCVAMTAPKQEKWVEQNRRRLDARVIIYVGAVFGFYGRTVVRPGASIQRSGLEWFFRFLRDPGRLWRRNLISLPRFAVKMAGLAVRGWFDAVASSGSCRHGGRGHEA